MQSETLFSEGPNISFDNVVNIHWCQLNDIFVLARTTEPQVTTPCLGIFTLGFWISILTFLTIIRTRFYKLWWVCRRKAISSHWCTITKQMFPAHLKLAGQHGGKRFTRSTLIKITCRRLKPEYSCLCLLDYWIIMLSK